MKNDVQLKEDVCAELDADPSVDTSKVGVTVRDGVVTLTGHLRAATDRRAVARAVQRVNGIKAIAIDLDFTTPQGPGREPVHSSGASRRH